LRGLLLREGGRKRGGREEKGGGGGLSGDVAEEAFCLKSAPDFTAQYRQIKNQYVVSIRR